MSSNIHTFFKQQPEEHRYKILRIPYHLVGDFFFQNRIEGNSIYAIKLHGMPEEGIRLQAMAIDLMAFTVDLRLYHPSWPIVDVCDEIPLLDVQIEQLKYRIIDKETCEPINPNQKGLDPILNKDPDRTGTYLSEKEVGKGSYIDPAVAGWHPEEEFPTEPPEADKYKSPEPKKSGYEFL